jgi:hypothetical protein
MSINLVDGKMSINLVDGKIPVNQVDGLSPAAWREAAGWRIVTWVRQWGK